MLAAQRYRQPFLIVSDDQSSLKWMVAYFADVQLATPQHDRFVPPAGPGPGVWLIECLNESLDVRTGPGPIDPTMCRSM